MTDLRQAAQQALEAHRMLRNWIMAVPQEVVLPAMPGIDGDWLDEVESNLRAALAQAAQPEQEPLATLFGTLPVYDTPPAAQRQWVGLTEEDWEHIDNKKGTTLDTFTQGAVWAEAKLKEKNGH
jgi:hypothetical protein